MRYPNCGNQRDRVVRMPMSVSGRRMQNQRQLKGDFQGVCLPNHKQQAHTARPVKRLRPDLRYSADFIKELRGVPWNTLEGKSNQRQRRQNQQRLELRESRSQRLAEARPLGKKHAATRGRSIVDDAEEKREKKAKFAVTGSSATIDDEELWGYTSNARVSKGQEGRRTYVDRTWTRVKFENFR